MSPHLRKCKPRCHVTLSLRCTFKFTDSQGDGFIECWCLYRFSIIRMCANGAIFFSKVTEMIKAYDHPFNNNLKKSFPNRVASCILWLGILHHIKGASCVRCNEGLYIMNDVVAPTKFINHNHQCYNSISLGWAFPCLKLTPLWCLFNQ